MTIVNYYIKNINLYNSNITDSTISDSITSNSITDDLPINANIRIKINPDDTNISDESIRLLLTHSLNKIILDNLTLLEISKLNESYYDTYIASLSTDIICPSIINPYDILVSATLHIKLFQNTIYNAILNQDLNFHTCIQNMLISYPNNMLTLRELEVLFATCIYAQLSTSNVIAKIALIFNLSIQDDTIQIKLSPSPSPKPIPILISTPSPSPSPTPTPLSIPSPTPIPPIRKYSIYIIVGIIVGIILFMGGISVLFYSFI